MFPHLHHVEVPLSTVHLTSAEEAGDVAARYGMHDAITRHRPGSMPSPMLAFFAPSRPAPRPSARRAAPPHHGPAPASAA